MSSAICFNLDQSKVLSSGNWLTHDRRKIDLFFYFKEHGDKRSKCFLTHYQIAKRLKFKAFADNNLYATQMMIFVFYRVENIAGTGENTGYKHSLLSPQCFIKLPVTGSLKVVIMWERVNPLPHNPDFYRP